METILTSEGNFLTKTENKTGNFNVNYQYGSHTGNVWTNWYENSFNSLHEAIDYCNHIVEEFHKDNESYSWNRRLDINITGE